MVKWLRLTEHQYIGFFALGLAFFVMQELPYIIMAFFKLNGGPIMAMTNKSAALNTIEKICGVTCIVFLLFLVRNGSDWFPLSGKRDVLFFVAAMLALLGYFIGWIFYWNGNHGLALILGALVALPPVYYAFLGLWRGNTPLAVMGALFLAAHMSNVWNNLR